MNERTIDLYKQSIEFAYNSIGKEHSNTAYFQGTIAGKFAELIVRECIGCCEQVISDPVPESVDTWLNGGEQCIQEIKQHFSLGMSVADKKQLIKDLLGVNNDTES
jgi:hypothetical protein